MHVTQPLRSTPMRIATLAVLVATALHGTNGAAQTTPAATQADAMPRMPTRAEIEAAMEQQRRAMPKVPGTASPTTPVVPDLAELAKQYEAIRRGRSSEGVSGVASGAPGADRQASGLLVFASLGMPRASLERMVADAERVSAVMVLRGVQAGSLRQTAASIQQLLGPRKVAWQIDPSLFKRFEVSAVPAVVLIDPARPVQVACGNDTCSQPAFSKVTGDVSLGHALEAMERQDPEFSRLAALYGARLRGGR
jgi:conjugal transfer pilus assembly protein TrbC